jgi:SpoIID/LytB domain protein
VWRLRTVSGRTVLDYHNGAWRTYLPGGRALSGAAEFYRSGSVALRAAGTTRLYRGAMRLASNDTVNVLSIDDYIKGVVPREMPASWHTQAVRAQAVAARTYGAWERAAHPTRHYQTCDTTSCQVYGGVASEHSASNAAVDATAGQVLLYGGKPAFTQFASSSGGWTSAGSMPYLVAKADRYDGHSGNPVHSWTASVTKSAIQKAWPALGTLNRIRITQRDGNGEWYGRVEKMELDGTRSDVTVSGSTFRSRFGLRSQWFRPAGGTTSSSTTTATPTAITLRWRQLGGRASVVGSPITREYAIGAGRTRAFEHGRIFYKYGAGARELHGKVLRSYLEQGHVTSRLGFPRTGPIRHTAGTYARFEKGTLFVYRSGKVRVTYSG